jgi:transcriptional regulator with XRE-family HTH domain
MNKTNAEDLKRYVKRVMKQKGLTLRDIEIRSGGKITDGYVSGIITGIAKNPSVEKIKALAQGLGVSIDEVFHVACGTLDPRTSKLQGMDSSQFVMLLDLMHQIVVNPDLMEILKELVYLGPDERAVMLRTLKAINQSDQPQRNAEAL